MPKWTEEQQEAINKEGANIIVSAGAGSGKTAVLSERVIRKLKEGINVNELLILTFTKASAFEMKERIRKKISQEEILAKQLEYIDSSYITTFDSYALSIVKKYHYLLNIPKDIAITDASIIYLAKNEIINDIFNELYTASDPSFLNLISTFCTKDDKDIKKYILSISSKLDLKYDKEDYLNNYLDNYYNDTVIDNSITKFNNMLKKKITTIKTKLELLSNFVDSNYLNLLYDCFNPLFNASNYDEILANSIIKMPNLPKNSMEEAKNIKEELTHLVKDLSNYLTFDNTSSIKLSITSTKDYVSVIIKIILELDKRLNNWKEENNLYEFIDISKMAIKIVKENEEVREELKYFFKEIMIDEYQDTSDLQEEFISLIENNNVYMVGDIKQSIYRFRNANPYIFKNKYDNYSHLKGGYKIDLNKNFRSRKEVLDNINLIFNLVMNDEIGGADYINSHQMIFGNNAYLIEGNTKQNNNFEILNYSYPKDYPFTKEEIEIFTIANDIKNKVTNNYKVFDKDLGLIRDITYSDFVILMDRTSKFDLYKKIFGYLKIPLTKYTDTSITNERDTLIIKNIISLIINTYNKNFNIDFKYSFTSVARSFLFSYRDQEIFDYLDKDSYLSSSIMTIINTITSHFDNLTPRTLLEEIIDKFDIYNRLNLVGDVSNSLVRYEYLINLSSSLEQAGYSINDFYNYLDTLINDNYDIKVSIQDDSSNSVKIMTIHKSKGLEYHICYYPSLFNKFNISDLQEKFLYDNNYGIITPYFNEGISNTIYKYLLKEDYLKEEISEKIRLFYVALTRAKEKMILVTNIEENLSSNDNPLNYRSFLDILKSIYLQIKDYIINVDINTLGLTKDYNLIRKSNYQDFINKTDNKLDIKTINITNEEITNSHFSKTINGLIDKATKNKLAFGEYMHYLLEVVDFVNPKYELIEPSYRSLIANFINCGLDFKKAKIYKEYEFIDEDSHGIIDLVLEYQDKIIIVDYKLKNIADINYLKQLNGYKNYLTKKTSKEISIYLYSIMESRLECIDGEVQQVS